MTTEGPAPRPVGTGVRVEGLGLATVSVTATGALLAGLGALLDGGSAALGAALGAALVVGFFSFGAVSVNLVAGIAPKVSMLVALMTYTLQVLLLALALIALARSDLAPDTIDPRWLGGAVLLGTLVWMSALIVGTLRAGVPPVEEAPATGPDTTAGETSHAAGETR
jgi:ATP synthase protein I